MRLVALTGGIGSGKSTVSAGLVRRGAHLIDADAIVKELQQPGAPVYNAMVERWGGKVLLDGQAGSELDRAAVASIVFADPDELKALNELVHPTVRDEMRRRMDSLADTDDVVILDIPLLAEGGGKHQGSAVIVVDCPTDIAVERLIEFRGFDRDDAEARVAAQATREQRLALADFVVDNSGTPDTLEAEIDGCWAWLQTVEPTPWPPPERDRAGTEAD